MWIYIYIYNGAMTTCTSDANANIPHINIKMLTMSSVHWWLILHVHETVLIANNLHCFKPIPTPCNSFAGNVSRMWLNMHSHNSKWIAPAARVCSMWLWKGVGEILQPSWPIVRISYVTTQNITVTKFMPLYQHRCGYNAHQNVKSHCFVVLVEMSFQLL